MNNTASKAITKFVNGVAAAGTIKVIAQGVTFEFDNGCTGGILTNPDGTFASAVAWSDGACIGSYKTLAAFARVAS